MIQPKARPTSIEELRAKGHRIILIGARRGQCWCGAYHRTAREPENLNPLGSNLRTTGSQEVEVRPATEIKRRIRLPLTKMQTAYFVDAKKNMDNMLRLIAGIEVRSEEDSQKTIQELRDDIGRGRFSLRGFTRMLRSSGVRLRGVRLAKKVIYASDEHPTHRVLVYAFAGLLLMEASYEGIDGEISILPCYDPPTYIVTPLAKVDVRVNYRYLSGRYKDLMDFREAVERQAERIAWHWFRRFCSQRYDHGFQSIAPWSSGLTAEVIRALPRSFTKPNSEVLKNEAIDTGPTAPIQWDAGKPPSQRIQYYPGDSRDEYYPRR